MRIQPTSVTVIGWILIVLAVVRALYADQGRQNPEIVESFAKAPISFSTWMLICCADVAVLLLSGVMLLRGANWARYLFVIWATLFLTATFFLIDSSWRVGINAGLLALFAYLLFRPHANAYFAGRFPPSF